MKLGLLTSVLGRFSRAEAFDKVVELGLSAVELGTGEFGTDFHVGVQQLLGDRDEVDKLKTDLRSRELELSALSCHGNPLHPSAEYATRADTVFRNTVQLAAMLEVEQICLFAGCPGTPDGGNYPNWVICHWPDYFSDLLDWQWDERIIPYWTEAAEYARKSGVKLGFEMHPGDAVYNMDTLLRLRGSCGDNIGANYDPSHLWWQGVDPLRLLDDLAAAGMLYHVHAKDTAVHAHQVSRDGVLTSKPMDAPDRPWRFATVGYGHDAVFWRQFVSGLRSRGYEGVISIEHEDPLASSDEGVRRAVAVLKEALWHEPSDELAWLKDPPTPIRDAK